MLKHLLHSEIDKVKWNHCISKSDHALLYAEAEYLDALAVNWDALVLNDYESVMPLCWKSKWGINYLYQPPFVQQSGIFSTKPLSDIVVQQFINAAAIENVSESSVLIKDIPFGFGALANIQVGKGILNLAYALGSQQGNGLKLNSAKFHFGVVNYF